MPTEVALRVPVYDHWPSQARSAVSGHLCSLKTVGTQLRIAKRVDQACCPAVEPEASFVKVAAFAGGYSTVRSFLPSRLEQNF